jgi:hypothetical protein
LTFKLVIQVCLVTSALLLAIAPAFLGADYDWLTHTTSESAAQNTERAWIARTAFALYGAAILMLSFSSPPPSRLRYLPFAASMLLVAIWSHRPYLSGRTFDPVEDSLHSVAATLVGISFVVAVISSLLAGKGRPRTVVALDVSAILASAVIPLIMANADYIRGLAQRTMFLMSYVWFIVEVQINPPPRS